MNSTLEEWREVPGTNGWYEVSSEGRVRSWKNGRWGRRSNDPRILRPAAGLEGRQYLTVNIGRRTRRVHELVALAFLGPRPSGMEICHGDGDYFNNAASNLRYDTQSGNSADKFRHGTMPLGENHHNAVLTEAQVWIIRSRIAAGETIRGVARAYGVSAATISDIKLGKTWSHLV